jgi:hypothetical protein
MVSWEHGSEDEAQYCAIRASAYLASYIAGHGLAGCNGMPGINGPLAELRQAIRNLSEAARLKPEKNEYSELLSILCALYLNQRSGKGASVPKARMWTEHQDSPAESSPHFPIQLQVWQDQ